MSKVEIHQKMSEWVSCFAQKNAVNISALYDNDAILSGTFSPIKRNTPALIKDYFDDICTHKKHSVTITDATVRIFDHVAVSTGLYTFNFLMNNTPKTIDARFTFVYIKRDNGWVIIEHHSSIIPKV